MTEKNVINIEKIKIKKVVKEGEKQDRAIAYYYKDGVKKQKSVKLYSRKGKIPKIIILEGHQFWVRFNDLGVSEAIKHRGINNKITNRKYNKTNLDEIKSKVDTMSSYKKQKEEIVAINPDAPIKHEKFNQIKACVSVNVPVYLYGPAGSGKNHVLQQIAEELGLDFYFTNSVQQEFKITGFIDAGGNYHETEFYRAFKNGGLFFLDEMDASIPEVLVLLNAALANGYFEFPTGKIDAHKDFRVVAAGNTVGTGADEQYSGRLQLDQATLDRFAMIEFDYDKNIELSIAKGNKELVEFIRDLRKQSKEKGINTTFSYRCISMVIKLELILDLSEVLKMAVIKGLDKDTINTFQTNYSNKYSKELWKIKQAG